VFSRAAVVGALLCAAPAISAEFYEGKSITLLIGTSAGGGYDTYSRTIARHMPKHIPGAPTVVPRNQPGAGSATAALFNTAPKDGTWIGSVFPGVLIEPPRRFRSTA
jgi:tripartite-type tricarboxylate transporter receptor subunit TctC